MKKRTIYSSIVALFSVILLFVVQGTILYAAPKNVYYVDDEGGYDSVKRVFESATYVSSMNLLGLPVGIAPIGMHDTSPISVQLIGPRYREDLCLDAAAVIERALARRRRQAPQFVAMLLDYLPERCVVLAPQGLGGSL